MGKEDPGAISGAVCVCVCVTHTHKSYANNCRTWLICGSHGWRRKVRSFKFLLHREESQHATPIFSSLLIQVTSIKVSFLAWMSRFGAFKPDILNINARKAFRWLLVSNLYDHVLTSDQALFRKLSSTVFNFKLLTFTLFKLIAAIKVLNNWFLIRRLLDSTFRYWHYCLLATPLILIGISINIFQWNQLYMKGKPKLHLLYEYQRKLRNLAANFF